MFSRRGRIRSVLVGREIVTLGRERMKLGGGRGTLPIRSATLSLLIELPPPLLMEPPEPRLGNMLGNVASDPGVTQADHAAQHPHVRTERLGVTLSGVMRVNEVVGGDAWVRGVGHRAGGTVECGHFGSE